MLHAPIESPVFAFSVPGRIETVSPHTKTPLSPRDVERWIADARGGDREALGRLLERYRHYLSRIAGRELAPSLRAKVAPSDLVQDTFLEAGRDFARFRGRIEAELRGWLRRILRNNLTNVHRHFETGKRQVGREVPWEYAALHDRLRGDSERIESPSAQAQDHEWDDRLECALRRLPERYGRVLRLHGLDEWTFVRIAAEFDSTAEAIRKLWNRAVAQFTKQLGSPQE